MVFAGELPTSDTVIIVAGIIESEEVTHVTLLTSIIWEILSFSFALITRSTISVTAKGTFGSSDLGWDLDVAFVTISVVITLPKPSHTSLASWAAIVENFGGKRVVVNLHV